MARRVDQEVFAKAMLFEFLDYKLNVCGSFVFQYFGLHRFVKLIVQSQGSQMAQFPSDTRFYSHKFARYTFQFWRSSENQSLNWCRLLMFFVLEELKLLRVSVKRRETPSMQREASRLFSSLTFRFSQETGHPK